MLESKTGKKKGIIVPAKVWEIVELRRQAFPKDEYVFTSHSNRASGKTPVSREQVNREIKQAAENVGIKGTVGCHSFRKFSASQAWEKSNGNLVLAMKALNHSDPKVTMNYLKINVKSVSAALANIWERSTRNNQLFSLAAVSKSIKISEKSASLKISILKIF